MLTVVLLFLLPAVLVMSVYRLVQLPRDLRARRTRFNSRPTTLCALGFASVYCALAAYTALVLFTAARAIWMPPKTMDEILAAAFVGAAYPLVYLGFEWVLYYCVKPVVQA